MLNFHTKFRMPVGRETHKVREIKKEKKKNENKYKMRWKFLKENQ